MPQATRRCRKCPNKMPCPDHPQGWARTKAIAAHPLPRDWRSKRRAAWNRDEGTCQMCGKFLGLKVNAKGETDHIVPRHAGGSDDLSNLRTLCVACHKVKTLADRRKYGVAATTRSVGSERSGRRPVRDSGRGEALRERSPGAG